MAKKACYPLKAALFVMGVAVLASRTVSNGGPSMAYPFVPLA